MVIMIGVQCPSHSEPFVSETRVFVFKISKFCFVFLGFILFSITLLIGLRARPRELFVLAMLTAALVVILVPILSVQMFRKPQIIFDLSDLFLLIVAIISGSIVIDIFLYIHSLRKFRSRNTFAKANRQFSPVEL